MRILIIDKSAQDRKHLKFLLNLGGYFDLGLAGNIDQAYRLLGIDCDPEEFDRFDLILIDILMPGEDGIGLLKKIKTIEWLQDIPVIVVTKHVSLENMLLAYESGAADYITKPLTNKIELLPRVNAALSLKHEIETRKAREQELMELTRLFEQANRDLMKVNRTLESIASIDSLTGIANRRNFQEFFTKEWKRAVRHFTPMTIIMIDIDFFKAYNDAFGHPKGDQCLKKIATALKDSLKRPGDLVARYGGEEFIVLLSETDSSGALRVADQMRQAISNLNIEHPHSSVTPQVTVSMGIATTVPRIDSKPEDLTARADKALYRAKQSGRNRLCIFDDPLVDSAKQLRLVK